MVKAFHYVQKKCVGKVGVRFFHVSQKAREIAIVSLFPYFLWGGNSPLNFVPKKLIYFGTVGLHPLFYSVATCRYRHFYFLFLFYFSFFLGRWSCCSPSLGNKSITQAKTEAAATWTTTALCEEGGRVHQKLNFVQYREDQKQRSCLMAFNNT